MLYLLLGPNIYGNNVLQYINIFVLTFLRNVETVISKLVSILLALNKSPLIAEKSFDQKGVISLLFYITVQD